MGWKGVPRTAASAVLAGAAVLVLAAVPPAGAGPRTAAVTVAVRQDVSSRPPAPRLPRDFRGRGRWIVRDLDITVPFTWEGKDGDSQMTAGGPQYPIWFTNLIYL